MKFDTKEKILLFIFLGLVALDQLTKLLTIAFIDDGQYITLIPDVIQLQRHINQRPFEVIMIANKNSLTTLDYWNKLEGMILVLLLLGIYFLSKNRGLERYKRYFIGVVATILFFVLAALLQSKLESVKLNELFVMGIVVIVGVLVHPIGMFLVHDNYFRAMLLFGSAGNWGNLISFFYHPYRIVDMIGFFPTLSIYNFADIYAQLTYTLFFLSPIYVFIISYREDQQGRLKTQK